jgi:hypothetical protein
MTAMTATLSKAAVGATVKVAAAAAAGPDPVVDSVDFTSYDQAEMSAVMDNWWPESLGLPDNSSLAQLLSGTWNSWNAQNPPSQWLPAQPANLSAATFSVASDGGTGSILTITAPQPPGGITVTSGSNPGWNRIGAGFMAQLAGAAAGAGAMAICGAFLFGLPTNDSRWAPAFGAARMWTQAVCGGANVGAWASAATEVGTYLTTGDAPTSGTAWHAIIGAMLGGAVGGFSFPYAAPLIKVVQYVWLGLQFWIGSTNPLLGWLSPYLSPTQADHLLVLFDFLTTDGLALLTNPLLVAKAFGFWTPVAAGYVGNVPTGAVVTVGSGDCMDAWLSQQTEPASPLLSRASPWPSARASEARLRPSRSGPTGR